MNKLLRDPSYKNNEGFNSLDLSSDLKFSSTVAHVMPVMWDFLQPGDTVRLRSRLRTRTLPLISAAFGDIEEHVRYFFVPMSQIYKPYEQLYNGIQDFGSDFYKTIIESPSRLTDLLPSITLADIRTFLLAVIDDSTSEHLNSKDDKLFDALRLLECLGVPVQTIFTPAFNTQTSWSAHRINLLPLLAYHKIWFDYMRDSDRIPNDPSYYNADSWCDVNIRPSDGSFGYAFLWKLFTLHCCPVSKDTVNNVFVSPLFGENGVGGDKLHTLTNAVNNWLTSVTPAPRGVDGLGNRTNPTTIAPTPSQSPSVNQITVATLRSSFAVNKLLEITRRAKKHYDAQILAHFGVDVPMGVNGEAIEIGHHKQELVIGDVISTADTALTGNTGAMLGEVGGKGYGNDVSDKFKFKASTHGVLMAVYYARPRFVYQQTGLDKKLLYARISDIPRPEYDDLGQQPVFRFNRQIMPTASENSVIDNWEYRFSEVKSQMSRAILGLSRSLKSWCISRSPLYAVADAFYCTPKDANQIFEIPYNVQIPTADTNVNALVAANALAFDTDTMIHQLSIEYIKASKLSTYGITSL